MITAYSVSGNAVRVRTLICVFLFGFFPVINGLLLPQLIKSMLILFMLLTIPDFNRKLLAVSIAALAGFSYTHKISERYGLVSQSDYSVNL